MTTNFEFIDRSVGSFGVRGAESDELFRGFEGGRMDTKSKVSIDLRLFIRPEAIFASNLLSMMSSSEKNELTFSFFLSFRVHRQVGRV